MNRQMAEKRLGNYLKSNLNDIRKDLYADYDALVLVIGKLGEGKTTLAMLCCFYVDETYGTHRIIFTKEQYDEMKNKLKKYQAMHLDEAINIFYSGDVTTKDQKDTIKDFHKIRGKNFFIMACVDDIFSLSRWISRERPTAVLRVVRRGVVEGYDADKAKQIRIDSQRNVVYPEPNFVDNFKPIPKNDNFWEEYVPKKDKYSLKSEDENPKIERMRKKMEKKLNSSMTIADISKVQHVSYDTVHGWIKKYSLFPKREMWKDATGRVRITIHAYERGMRKLGKIREMSLKRRFRRKKR